MATVTMCIIQLLRFVMHSLLPFRNLFCKLFNIMSGRQQIPEKSLPTMTPHNFNSPNALFSPLPFPIKHFRKVAAN